MRSFWKIVLMLAMSLGLVSQADAGDPINKNKDLALKGFDTVAYFKQGRAVKGDPQFATEWMGARWLFSSTENLDAFKAEPERYAPQFGGYCAYAVSEGYLYDADPEIWKIVDGKLYLNYNNTARKRWETDIPGRIAQGEKHWPTLIN